MIQREQGFRVKEAATPGPGKGSGQACQTQHAATCREYLLFSLGLTLYVTIKRRLQYRCLPLQ